MARKAVSLPSARNLLAVVWLAAALPIMVILIIQTGSGRYGSQASRAWAWYFPNILPTLTLILATLGYHAKLRDDRSDKVDRFFFRVTLAISLFYLIAVVGTLLAQPFADGTPLEWLERSQLFLGPLQGLTAGALAVFFESAKSTEKDK